MIMKPTTLLPLLPLVFALPAPSTNAAPSSLTIKGITYGGSGCPQGTLDTSVSDTNTIPLTYSNAFAASIGPNVDVTQNRKNCQINLDLQFSPGYQYTVVSADYHGYGDLQSGVNGKIRANYYFSGQTAQAVSESDLSGPFTGPYSKHDDVAISAWSPCGSEAMLNVDSEVALTSSNAAATGLLTSDKSNARFTHNVYLRWRSC